MESIAYVIHNIMYYKHAICIRNNCQITALYIHMLNVQIFILNETEKRSIMLAFYLIPLSNVQLIVEKI